MVCGCFEDKIPAQCCIISTAREAFRSLKIRSFKSLAPTWEHRENTKEQREDRKKSSRGWEEGVWGWGRGGGGGGERERGRRRGQRSIFCLLCAVHMWSERDGCDDAALCRNPNPRESVDKHLYGSSSSSSS